MEEPITQQIEFLERPDLVGKYPRPIPAAQAIPDWFKSMPPLHDTWRTVKRCPPFLEAMSSGYILPIAADTKIIRTQTELKVEMEEANYPLMDMHNPKEFHGAPMGDAPLVKFVTPWIIKTPPGYSMLFVAPLNRFEAHIMPLSGVVETDLFYRPVAIPTMVFIPPGSELYLKAGTPLVQVMPFRRETWQSVHAAWDDAYASEVEREQHANLHLYKEKYWRKKTFG